MNTVCQFVATMTLRELAAHEANPEHEDACPFHSHDEPALTDLRRQRDEAARQKATS